MRIIRKFIKIIFIGGVFLFYFPYEVFALEKGDLLFRTAQDGEMYGRNGFFELSLKKLRTGHVGIYIGEYGDIENAVIEAAENGMRIIPSEQFIFAGNGEEFIGVKTVRELLTIKSTTEEDKKRINIIRQNIVDHAIDQKDEKYDFDFGEGKGPNDGDWICVGLAEKVYESANSDTLVYDPAKYALDITPDGFDNKSVVNANGDCFSSTVEYSKVQKREVKSSVADSGDFFAEIAEAAATRLLGKEHDGERYFFFPYTQFIQPTLVDADIGDDIVLESPGDRVAQKPNSLVMIGAFSQSVSKVISEKALSVKQLAVETFQQLKILTLEASKYVFKQLSQSNFISPLIIRTVQDIWGNFITTNPTQSFSTQELVSDASGGNQWQTADSLGTPVLPAAETSGSPDVKLSLKDLSIEIQDNKEIDNQKLDSTPADMAEPARQTVGNSQASGSPATLSGQNSAVNAAQPTAASTVTNFSDSGKSDSQPELADDSSSSLDFIHVFFSDTIPPETTIISQHPTLTNQTSISFYFSSNEINSSFQCQLDGQVWQNCASPQLYKNLTDGNHAFQAQAKDSYNNIDPTPAIFSWTIDATPPETTLTGHPENLTNRTAASFTFSSSEENSIFECKLDGSDWSACVSPKNYSNLADGARIFSVRAKDSAGNIDSGPAGFSWTVDTVPPPMPTIDPVSSPTSQSALSLSGSKSEDAEKIVINNSSEDVSYPSLIAWQKEVTLKEGDNNFQIRAIDSADNVSGAASASVILDSIVPDTRLDGQPGSLTRETSASFLFSSGESGVNFECQLDGGIFSACASPQNYANLSDGTHAFKVRAADAADNIDQTPANAAWTIDTVPPTKPGVNPVKNNLTNQPEIILSGTKAPDAEEIFINDSSIGVIYPTSDSWHKEVSLSEGENKFIIKAKDRIGNESESVSYAVVLDSVTPVAPVVSEPAVGRLFSAQGDVEAELSGVQLLTKGSAEAVNSIFIKLNEFEYKTNSDENGFWQINIAPREGENKLEIFSQDAAGNNSSVSVVYFVLDTVPPETFIDSRPEILTSQSSAVFAYHSSEENSTFQCRLDEGNWQDCSACVSGAYSVSYSDLADGLYTFKVRATDAAGNASVEPAMFSWTIDATPSGDANLFLFDQKTNSGAYAASRTVNIAVTDGADAAAWLVAENQTEQPATDDARWAASKPETFILSEGDGEKTVYVWTKDALDNVSLKGNSTNIFLDIVAPKIEISPLAPQQSIPTLSLAPIFSDKGVGVDHWEAQYKLTTDNLQLTTDWQYWQDREINTQNISSETGQVNFSGQDGTTYNFRFRVWDKAGNSSNWVETDTSGQTISTYFNLSVPDKPRITSLSDGQIIREDKINLEGIGRPGDLIILQVNASEEYQVAMGENNSWQISNIGLKMGLNTLRVKAREKDGDESEWSELLTVERVGPHYLKVVINEIAWMGTTASTNDEWMELYNNTAQTINFSGWILAAVDGTPKVNLSGTLAAKNYYLLERTGDTVINDIAANQIYTGALGNGGEKLELRDENGYLVDMVDFSGGWLAGDNATKKTAERINPLESGWETSNWATANALILNGQDAGGFDIKGTPKAQNSSYPYLFAQHIYTTPNSIRLAWIDPKNISHNSRYQLFYIQNSNCQNVNWNGVTPDEFSNTQPTPTPNTNVQFLPFENDLVPAFDPRAQVAKTLEISNLSANTNYCLAIKTSSDGSNWSPFSNIISKKTGRSDVLDNPLPPMPRPMTEAHFTPQGDTLTPENSPYYINAPRVNGDSGFMRTGWYEEVIMEPGTVVKFADTDSYIRTDTKMTIRGTLLNPVVFTSIKDDVHGGDTNRDGAASSPRPGDWRGMTFEGETLVDYAVIKYGGGWSSPLYLDWGPITISHSLIKNNLSGIYVESWGPMIRQNILTENGQPDYSGTYFSAAISSYIYATPTIVYNEIFNNRIGGIILQNIGSSQPIVSYNNIYNNYWAGLYSSRAPHRGWGKNSPIPAIDVRDNWWGSPLGPIYYSDCNKSKCDTDQSTWSQNSREAIHIYNRREALYQPFATERIVY